MKFLANKIQSHYNESRTTNNSIETPALPPSAVYVRWLSEGPFPITHCGFRAVMRKHIVVHNLLSGRLGHEFILQTQKSWRPLRLSNTEKFLHGQNIRATP